MLNIFKAKKKKKILEAVEVVLIVVQAIFLSYLSG